MTKIADHESELLPVTESHDDSIGDLGRMDAFGMVSAINAADAAVVPAVAAALPAIALAVEATARALREGGRLLYIGAGTSGRLGVLDASECPPTFGTDPGSVVGIIAGGHRALQSAVEGAEDNAAQGHKDLAMHRLSHIDVVVGLAASGSTPYVLGAMKYAREVGAKTVGISCNPGSLLGTLVDISVEVVVGPEVINGSTRMKAGTAQKMVLNMISTAAMVLLGKTYKNYMVDMTASNEKLRQRAIRLVRHLAGVSREEACKALCEAGWSVKEALVMLEHCVDVSTAQRMLADNANRINGIISD